MAKAEKMLFYSILFKNVSIPSLFKLIAHQSCLTINSFLTLIYKLKSFMYVSSSR